VLTVNELLADDATSHAVNLNQYSTGVVRRIISLLNKVDVDLADALLKALDRLPRESFTVERLEKLLRNVRRLNVAAYDAVKKELTPELKSFAEYESSYQYQLFRTVIPDQIQAEFAIASVNSEQVYAAALSRPFQGRLLKDWASKLEQDRLVVVRDAVRLGYVEGKTTSEIVQGLRGTRAAGYADGKLDRPRRELETVVRMAINHTASVARQNLIAKNAEIVDVVQWHSTLDTKTSEWCRIRDGLKYTAKKHAPVGHEVPWLGGPGKIHWNCRSTELPVVKSWRDLGFDIDELSPGTRASMDGQVSSKKDYGDWLQRQSAARQDEVVGVIRGRLMRSGELEFDKLYSPRGEWLSLDQLRERESAAFAKAGL
jgi:hypothetical protein